MSDFLKKIDDAIGEAFKPQPALPKELRKTTHATAKELADMAEQSARYALAVTMDSKRKLDLRRAGMQIAEMDDAVHSDYQDNPAEAYMKPLGSNAVAGYQPQQDYERGYSSYVGAAEAASLAQEAHEFLKAQDPSQYQQLLDELQQGENT